MKILKYIALSLIVLFLAALVLGAYFYKKTLMASNTLVDPIIIKIEDNSSVKEVAQQLASVGAISSEGVFIFTAILYKRSINAGFFEITPGMTMAEIMKRIDAKDIKLIKTVFPEGWRTEQMAKRLDDNKIVSFSDFIIAAEGKEGKLFPDTYLFNPKMTGAEVVKMMTDDFETRTSTLNLTDDQLILASIVEREAANDADRALIAGIYSNRLKIGMKMQSDPTVEYGRDTIAVAKLSEDDQKSYAYWKSAKTVEFSSVKSLFNTYQVDGLPAGPICNPGLKSIEAAQSPETTKYYYFLYGKDGNLYPSSTIAEHQALAAKYLYQ